MHNGVYEFYKTCLPEAVVYKHNEGITKGLRVYKIHRLHCACVELLYKLIYYHVSRLLEY